MTQWLQSVMTANALAQQAVVMSLAKKNLDDTIENFRCTFSKPEMVASINNQMSLDRSYSQSVQASQRDLYRKFYC
jgi:hypothetical protein